MTGLLAVFNGNTISIKPFCGLVAMFVAFYAAGVGPSKQLFYDNHLAWWFLKMSPFLIGVVFYFILVKALLKALKGESKGNGVAGNNPSGV